MDIDRRAFLASLGGATAVALMTSEQKADALEGYMEEGSTPPCSRAAGAGAAEVSDHG